MRIFWNRITLQARLVCLGLVVNVTLIGLLASLALWAAQTLVRDSLTERDIEVRALLTMAALADQGGSSNREQPSWSGILEQAGGLSYLQWLDRNGKVRVQTGRFRKTCGHSLPRDRSGIVNSPCPRARAVSCAMEWTFRRCNKPSGTCCGWADWCCCWQ